MTKNNILVFPVLFFFAFLVCYCSSCFSPINGIAYCGDPATFYMCAKAWYHGYVPYVDVIDLKGPLLFVIFLLGQIITPDDTLGIFIVQTFVSFITLILLYKTANIFLKDAFASSLATILTLFFIWSPNTSVSGCQPELFIIPFGAWLVYALTSLLYSESIEKSHVVKLGIATGVGATGALLIKFNTALPFLATFFVVCLYLYCRKNYRKYLFSYIWVCSCSFVVSLLPFVIWMSVQGNLSHCFHWYVTTNLQTYFTSENCMIEPQLTSPLKKIYALALINVKKMILNPSVILPISALFTTYFNNDKDIEFKNTPRFILLIVFFSFFVACFGNFKYYHIFESTLSIFPAILVSYHFKKHKVNKLLYFLLFLFLMYHVIHYNDVVRKLNSMTPNAAPGTAIYQFEHVLGKEKNKTILYWKTLEKGYGKNTLLPAIPLWTRFNGATDLMDNEQLEAVKNRKADFIVVGIEVEQENLTLLESSGYIKVLTAAHADFAPLSLWKKSADSK